MMVNKKDSEDQKISFKYVFVSAKLTPKVF